MNPFEKTKFLGQQLGVAPNNNYLCAEYVVNKKDDEGQFIIEEEEQDEMAEYSLVVESDEAIVVTVKKYEV